jgi:DNA-binding winged helix-turn-helix (wHTH) protein
MFVPIEQDRPSTLAYGEEFRFGEFSVIPAKRLLLDGGNSVQIGSRAFDVLVVLLGHAGDLVSKSDLIRYVWPETNVLEANLAVHIAALRRILRDGQSGRRYIVNVPGRGYHFVERVKIVHVTTTPAKVSLRFSPQLGGRTVMQEPGGGRLPMSAATGLREVSVCSVAAAELLVTCRHGAWYVDLRALTGANCAPAG